MRPADHPVERSRSEKAIDCQLAHRNDDARPDDRDLALEPRRTGVLLVGRWDAIATAAGARARITPRDCGDVDLATRGDLVDSSFAEPFEERATCSPGERLAALSFHLARRLPDEHDPRRDGERGDRPDIAVMGTA